MVGLFRILRNIYQGKYITRSNEDIYEGSAATTQFEKAGIAVGKSRANRTEKRQA